jgi:hypothetical protein
MSLRTDFIHRHIHRDLKRKIKPGGHDRYTIRTTQTENQAMNDDRGHQSPFDADHTEGIHAYQDGKTNSELVQVAGDLLNVDPDRLQQVVVMAVVVNEEMTAGALGIVTNLNPDELTPFLVQAMKSHFEGLDKGMTVIQDNTKGQLNVESPDSPEDV